MSLVETDKLNILRTYLYSTRGRPVQVAVWGSAPAKREPHPSLSIKVRMSIDSPEKAWR